MRTSRYSNYDDDELLGFLRLGNHAAFEEIFNRYWGDLLDAAFQRLKSREASEDILQEVFMNLFVRVEQITLKSTLEAYLKTALKYKIIDAYRTQQRYYKYLDRLVEEMPARIIRPSDELEMKELREKVHKVADRLPEKCRRAFLLSRFDELSHQEIAQRMNISVVTVKSHLNKALRILKEEFGDNRFELLTIGFLILLR